MAAFFHRKHSTTPQVDNPYWMSFSDMMSGMLIIFILVSIALLFKLSKMKEDIITATNELRESSQIRNDILDEIEHELKSEGVEVIITDNHTVIRISADTLSFDTNSDKINDNDTAIKIGYALKHALNKDNRTKHLETVFVEGHTDSRPTSDYHGGNWGLSTQRAISLWKLWTEPDSERNELNELGKLTNWEGKPLFSVSGYADTRPARPREKFEMDEIYWKANRRIDIRFTTKQPTLKDWENTLK